MTLDGWLYQFARKRQVAELDIVDYDIQNGASGTRYITLKDAVADALSVRRGTTDMIVFDTSTPRITITPVVTITGLLTLTAGATISSGGSLTITKGVVGIGTFSSATAGSGIALSSSVTGAMKVYSDDAGAAMTGSIRGLLSRVLLTIDHPGDLSVRGAIGQLKLADLVDLTNGISSGLEGYVELAGTNNFGATSFVSGMTGIVELTTASTITAGGYLAGVASIYKSTATPTGTCAAFITKIGSTAKWPIGLLIPVGTAACAISVGVFASATAGSGMKIDATNTAAVRFYGDDGGAKLAAGEKRVGIARFLYATSDTDATDQTMSAFVGQVKLANDLTIGGNLAGLCGYLEIAAAKTLIGGRRTQMSIASALWARIDMPSTAVIGTSGIVSGLAISANLGGTHTGACSMINVTTPSAGTWDYFLDFGASPGAIVADTTNLPAAATYKIKCRYDSTDFYLIGVADF
jgi:hypothetical protein